RPAGCRSARRSRTTPMRARAERAAHPAGGARARCDRVRAPRIPACAAKLAEAQRAADPSAQRAIALTWPPVHQGKRQIMIDPIRRVWAALLALAVVAGCTTNPYTGEQQVSRTATTGAIGA